MTSQGTGGPHVPGETIEAWRASGFPAGPYVGLAADGQEKLILPGAGASGTFRYLLSDGGLTRATIDAEGSGVLEIRLGGFTTSHLLTAGPQEVELVRAPAGRYEITLTLRSGSAVEVSALSFA